MKTAKFITYLIIPVLLITAFSSPQDSVIRDDFQKYYEQFNVTGSFVLYDQNNDQYTFYNQQQSKELFSPASTYKICNSLIGLETGIIKGEDFVINWDKVKRPNPNWNSDQNLKSAFQNSTVWYYQELARRVGGKKMKYWLDTLHYGNADTSGGIDMLWLTGGLRITPLQQIDFLRNLHNNQLPFSQRSMDIVKNIMVTKDTLGYVVRAKGGWGMQGKTDIGWYVGYIETKGNVYYFANCIQNTDEENKSFGSARVEIVYLILNELGLIGG